MGRADTSEYQTPESLRAALERIRHLTAAVEAVADQMEAEGLERLKFAQQAALERALEELVRWTGAIHLDWERHQNRPFGAKSEAEDASKESRPRPNTRGSKRGTPRKRGG